MNREGYLNIGQVAAKMGVSEATVWALVKRCEIDRFKFPGDRRTYVAEKDLGTLMEPERIGGPGAAARNGRGVKKAA